MAGMARARQDCQVRTQAAVAAYWISHALEAKRSSTIQSLINDSGSHSDFLSSTQIMTLVQRLALKTADFLSYGETDEVVK
jgi:hypothetical protein